MHGEKVGEVERKRIIVKQRNTENTHICDGHQLCVHQCVFVCTIKVRTR